MGNHRDTRGSLQRENKLAYFPLCRVTLELLSDPSLLALYGSMFYPCNPCVPQSGTRAKKQYVCVRLRGSAVKSLPFL
jgi:hypothetical protein